MNYAKMHEKTSQICLTTNITQSTKPSCSLIMASKSITTQSKTDDIRKWNIHTEIYILATMPIKPHAKCNALATSYRSVASTSICMHHCLLLNRSLQHSETNCAICATTFVIRRLFAFNIPRFTTPQTNPIQTHDALAEGD